MALILIACACRSTQPTPVAPFIDASRAPALDYRLVPQSGHSATVRALATSSSGLLAITASADGEVRVWETDAGRVIRTFRKATRPARSAAISQDDTLVAFGDEDGVVVVWELASGREVARHPIHDSRVEGLAFHNTDLVSVGGDGILDVRPVRGNGKPQRFEPEPGAGVNGASATPDGTMIAVALEDYGVEVWALDGTVVDSFHEAMASYMAVSISRDGSTVVAAADGHTHYVFRHGEIAPHAQLRSNGNECAGAAVSKDGSQAAIGCSDGSIDLYDLRAGTTRPLHEWRDGDPSVNDVWGLAFTRDGRRLFATIEASVGIWNLETTTRLTSAPAYAPLTGLRVDGHRAIASSRDGIHVWNLDELRMIEWRPTPTPPPVAEGRPSRFTVAKTQANDGVFRIGANGGEVNALAIGEDWVVWSDDGYFDGSRGGLELLTAARGARAWYADQVGIVGNRPDVLLARLGVTGPLRDHFELRARGRRARTVQPVGHGAPPELQLGDVTLEPGGTAVAVTARATGSTPLARLHVRANGVPVFGSAGKAITGSSIEIRERIPVVPGPNRIEVGVADIHGVESMRAVRTVETSRAARSRLVFVGFGISHYRNAALDLRYADKDATDLARIANSMSYAFRGVATHVWINEQVTRDAWNQATALVAKTSVDDVLVVLLSGHGAYSELDGNYYFLTHDSDVDDLEHTAVPYATLEALVEAAPARRRLVLIDTCQSGELDAPVDGSKLRVRGAKAVVRKARPAAGAATRPLGLDGSRLIESDLQRKTGAIVMSASRGNEPSIEDDATKNGLFTASVMEGLAGGADVDFDLQVTASELLDYVRRTVPERSHGIQHPTIDRDNPLADIRIPLKGRP